MAQAIDDLPAESKTPPVSHSTLTENTVPVMMPENDQPDTTSTNKGTDAPMSPTKGELKVKNHGLKKSHISKQSYKCQSCGKCEKSVHELNEHHRTSHPPLMCGDCNKLFKVPSVLQLHIYDHQKKETSMQNLWSNI